MVFISFHSRCLPIKVSILSLYTTDKQERTVIHLELGAEHHYFDSIKALCDHFGKEQIGITYKSFANIGITPDKPYSNKYCTIRKGTLLTAPKAVSENGGE